MGEILKRLTLAGATMLLVLTVQTAAAGPTAVSSVYTVGSLGVPGVDTGLVLKKGRSVSVTATGTFCPGTGYCVGPDGYPSGDSTDTSFGGFVLPGAPAYGLVGRVGSGHWVHVGSGPTKLSGSGVLVFAVNDDYFPDNSGDFTVTVTFSRGSASQVSAPTSCHPGWGNGDANHDHTGPPGQGEDACYPGHGYGDKNHDHSGPPGQANQQGSQEHGKSSANNGR